HILTHSNSHINSPHNASEINETIEKRETTATASLSGALTSKTFVVAILVIVALGLAAMGGYVAKGLSGSGAAASQSVTTHAAPGTVLRQGNPKPQPVVTNNHPTRRYRELGYDARCRTPLSQVAW